MPLWLTETDVRAVLDPAGLIGAMESALAAFSAGRVVQPVRSAFEIGERSFFAVMPAFDGERAMLGAKLVTVVPGNAARGLHTHLAAIALFDAETGELLSVMDGRYITEVRTASVSAVSVRHLAREDSRVLAILGSGVQARSHLDMLPHVRRFTEIRVWSPTPENRRSLPGASAAESAEEAVRGADVILVATNSVTPVIESDWVSNGAHVIAIGACRPTQREIDPALVARARLVVDSRAAALQESGDIVQTIAEGRIAAGHIAAELGDIAAGRASGRTDPQQVTLFKSLGLAIEDVTAAAIAYRRACENSRGLRLTLT
jgi:alanine dehydrogenase